MLSNIRFNLTISWTTFDRFECNDVLVEGQPVLLFSNWGYFVVCSKIVYFVALKLVAFVYKEKTFIFVEFIESSFFPPF